MVRFVGPHRLVHIFLWSFDSFGLLTPLVQKDQRKMWTKGKGPKEDMDQRKIRTKWGRGPNEMDQLSPKDQTSLRTKWIKVPNRSSVSQDQRNPGTKGVKWVQCVPGPRKSWTKWILGPNESIKFGHNASSVSGTKGMDYSTAKQRHICKNGFLQHVWTHELTTKRRIP